MGEPEVKPVEEQPIQAGQIAVQDAEDDDDAEFAASPVREHLDDQTAEDVADVAEEDASADVAQDDDEAREQSIDYEGKPEDAIPEEDGEGDCDQPATSEQAAEEAETDLKGSGKSSAIDPIQRPPHGSEIFIGGITRETTEDDLRDLCCSIGELFEVRILKDKETGANKGYAFVTFMNKENAEKAIATLSGSEVKGKKVRVSHSQPKNRLFVGNIPKAWEKEELESVLSKEGQGITSIELLKDPKAQSRNRGFAFVEYYNHACAERARRNLSKPHLKLGGNQPTISWADPRPEPDPAAMSNVKVVYVKGLPDGTTEEQIKDLFSKHGGVMRIMLPAPKPGQPKRDFGFVHFAERSQALKAIDQSEKYELNGKALEVSLAKPPVEKRPPQEQYPPTFRAAPALNPYPQRGGGPSAGYGYPAGGSYGTGYGQSRVLYERAPAAPAPVIYGRGPAPAGMTMVPMVLPDGRVGYVFQPGGGGAGAPPPYRDGARASRVVGPAPHHSSPSTRRYRPY